MHNLDNYPLLEANISISAGGDNTVIVGVAGRTIRVFKLFLVVASNVTLTFKDGVVTAISGALPMTANGSIVLDFDGEHWFVTSLGNDFIINLSGAVGVFGRIYYTQSVP